MRTFFSHFHICHSIADYNVTSLPNKETQVSQPTVIDIKLQMLHSNFINTTIGLKYLNNNKTLYLKILENFTKRYESVNFYELNEEELKRTIHTIKGLTSTLGMEPLYASIIDFENHNNDISMSNCCENLLLTIEFINNLNYL
jgi:HPt (histidine-containing phosphotransfer) domain-containing protein